MPAWEREIGELPPPTFVPVSRKAGGARLFSVHLVRILLCVRGSLAAALLLARPIKHRASRRSRFDVFDSTVRGRGDSSDSAPRSGDGIGALHLIIATRHSVQA